MKPVILCIMDGVGISKTVDGNAFLAANTPNFDYLWNKFPHTLLEASGEEVGLPAGQMGNSEVGHLNIGAGRIVYQPLQLITSKIQDKTIYDNSAINAVINHVENNKTKLHILGMLSDGGVHSHINHLMGLIDMVIAKGIKKLYFHLFLDGRDTLPDVALKYLEQLETKLKEVGIGKISTISGRYYAMDRDNRWDRIKKAYDAIALGIGEEYQNYKDVIDNNYKRNITDEFVIPAVLDKEGVVEDNDGLLVFNFRPDRLRELFKALSNYSFNDFPRTFINNLKVTTMFPVSEEVISTPAFELEELTNSFGEYISQIGLKQLRIAETEKYAHVTYFFDGGVEKKLPNCNRVLISSPKVSTYDLKPEMSAIEVTDKLIEELDHNYDVVILNFANSDMVGHTGDFEATVKAVETVDQCLGRIYNKLKQLGGTLIVTADHGNCEYMLDNGQIITSHSINKVPFVVCQNNLELIEGKLGDIAPTILKILNIDIPKEMTGNVLIK